jgi:DNA-binding XRE family transcriptional regulator
MLDQAKLRAIRIKRKMSQEALARAAGVSLMTIHRLENSPKVNPSLETLTSIAKALQVNREDLLTDG